MAAKGEEEVSRQVEAQHRSVGFFSETDLVQIDPGNKSHGQNEDSELNETVGNLNQLLVTMHFNTALEVLKSEASIRQPHFICRDCFLLEYWLMKQDLDEMVILRLPRRNCGTASSFNFMQVLCVCVSNVYHQMCICQKTGLKLKGCLLGSIRNNF